LKDVEKNGSEGCLGTGAGIGRVRVLFCEREPSRALQRRVAEAAMDPATQSAAITALAAITGSIVGGLASFLTTFFTQRNQAHRDLLSRDVAHREELYSQFIKEATNLYIDSLDKTLENPASLIGMYSLVGRIRLVGSDKVLAAAEKLTETIVDSYSRPPRTFEDVYKSMLETHVDPLKEFTEACREERKSMLKSL
jgi:hypothetical protein